MTKKSKLLIKFKKPQNRRKFICYSTDVVKEGDRKRNKKRGKNYVAPKMIKGGPIPKYDTEIEFNEMLYDEDSRQLLEDVVSIDKVYNVRVRKLSLNVAKFGTDLQSEPFEMRILPRVTEKFFFYKMD